MRISNAATAAVKDPVSPPFDAPTAFSWLRSARCYMLDSFVGAGVCVLVYSVLMANFAFRQENSLKIVYSGIAVCLPRDGPASWA